MLQTYEKFCTGNAVNSEQYGLYCPLTDRIIFTDANKEQLRNLMLVFSSRYKFILCNLALVEGFDENLIDNTCCTNWTVDRTNQFIGISRFFDRLVVDIHKIKEVPAVNTELLIIQDLEYIHTVYYMITHLTRNPAWLEFMHNNTLCFTNAMDSPFKDSIKNKEEMIYQIAYHEFDFKKAKILLSEVQ